MTQAVLPETKGSNGPKILFSVLILCATTAIGYFQYLGPQPMGIDAPKDRPSAARMRETLEMLIGDPAQPHTLATEAGESFLRRLEDKIQSFGVETERIVIGWDSSKYEQHARGRGKPLEEGALIKNLLVRVEGTEPSLDPILIATHHDSCRWGPGAGDAGSAVVALVENIRIASLSRPKRTTFFLFTDGEEYGLIGANAIAEEKALPFEQPMFVLNYDARGSAGGVPMFETHPGNSAWVGALIPELAFPRITSSLAVTVYRSLPNATDFNVWDGVLGWSGFNYATIGDAFRYHQPHDLPENVSDRTLQHMGDHILSMRLALDKISSDEAERIREKTSLGSNAVFFDLFGVLVIDYSEQFQQQVAILLFLLLVIAWARETKLYKNTDMRRLVVKFFATVTLAVFIGFASQFMLRATEYANLVYTPIDFPAGMITIAVAFIAATLLLEYIGRRKPSQSGRSSSDLVWSITAVVGIALAFTVPGGAYLLLWPAIVYWALRLVFNRVPLPSWCGWLVMAVLCGPLLVLLVQALGPWKMPLYSFLAGLLAIVAMTAWNSSSAEPAEALSQ